MTRADQKARLVMGLRRAGVIDAEILVAFEKVPREVFVPSAFADQSYNDTALPIGSGQTISQPSIIGTMIAALEPDAREKVLEVGLGSGYQTAILSYLFRRVYAVDRYESLVRAADRRIAELRRTNVVTRTGDGALGWPEQAPFTRVIVSAAAEDLPPKLLEQLAPGGIMVVPIGDQHMEQRIIKVVKEPDGVRSEDLGPVRFLPLVAGLVRRREQG